MSYTINLTNGTTLIPGGLSDGTIDTSHTPLVLIGKNIYQSSATEKVPKKNQ